VSEAKTKPTGESVDAFIDRVPDERKREDCRTLVGLMREISGAEPQMWGSSIIGFGTSRYSYPSGREGDWPTTGFSPRSQGLTLYILTGSDDPDLLQKLGKHSTGKSCLYIKRLSDVDMPTLRTLIDQAVEHAAPHGLRRTPSTGG